MTIDKDKLIEIVYNKYPYITDIILECLNEMPEIEEKIGTWNIRDEEVSGFLGFVHIIPKYVCSSCGTKFDTRTKFCPECGARMDNLGVKPLGKEEWYS